MPALLELDSDQLDRAVTIKREIERRSSERKILTYFPESGPLSRHNYPKHMEFFRAGTQYRERLMLAANRVGKTESVGGYELAIHLTGWYPDWWEGRRFDRPINGWVAGTSGKSVRDILQEKLLGPVTALGTGLIPGEMLGRTTRLSGTADAIDTVAVKHKKGGYSHFSFKSYEQGEESFQGTEKDIIWLDEEPPLSVYTECLLRTMTNNGLILCTFTPLLGMSEVVLSFLPGGSLTEIRPDATKYVVMATWDDAPHLDEQAKKDLWASIPPFQRDARSKGIPQLGAGAIYPVPESDLLVDPFDIPAFWPQGYGMDVGWNYTAAVFGAYDRKNSCLYLTGEYKRGQAEPAVHVSGIKARGEWLHGFIDPASRGRGQRDGTQLFSDYTSLGLKLELADNGVESGLYSVWNRMSTGRLKVFKSMVGWLGEFRLYRRDEKGHVVKENDHLMDATRYLDSRTDQMGVKPIAPVETKKYVSPGQYGTVWMGG